MAPPPPDLQPTPGEQGLLSAAPDEAGQRALDAWDAFLEAVLPVDPTAVGRAKGRLGRETLLPLGAWPQTRSLEAILQDARDGPTAPMVDLDRIEREVLAAHQDATAADVRSALEAARNDLAAYLQSGDVTETRWLPTASPLGPLPVLTLLHAIGYQLALAALDLEPCGAVVPDSLLQIGVIALVDTTGALAARQGVSGSITAITPEAAWSFGAYDGSWRVRQTPAGQEPAGPAVAATARLLLDITAGRELNVPGRWRDGSLRTYDMAGLLDLAPVLDQVPGIPGGAALRTAARALGGMSRLLGGIRTGFAGGPGGGLSGGRTSE